MLLPSYGLLHLFFLAFHIFSVLATSSTVATIPAKRHNNAKNHFVTRQGTKLMVNGSEFNYIGTTAYWLSSLNTDEDIDHTLGNISQAGFNVVRTWGFNDVDNIPENGTWFQSVQNGTLVINDGPSGLQKLDKVMELAQKHGLYILLSLTNNWNPQPPPGSSNPLPRGTLSNDYGGMDFYVRHLGGPQEHDQFFTNKTLIEAFKAYTTKVVTRYSNHPNLLAWELANDPRCTSSINASSNCVAQNITRWHSDIAQHVKQHDPNHMVGSGHQGFFCVGCPKLFPLKNPPRPQPSPNAGTRRSVNTSPLTRERVFKKRKEILKKSGELARKLGKSGDGIRIRGRWISTPTRRQQDLGLGPAFDGTHGVDSEDITNIPQLDLSSFMLFPDQNNYGSQSLGMSARDVTASEGTEWINLQGDTSRTFDKPMTSPGMGIVSEPNVASFVAFNSSGPNTQPALSLRSSFLLGQQPFVTDEQKFDILRQWLEAGVANGIRGMVHYQWTQQGLTPQPGTVISPTSPVDNQTPTSQVNTQTGTSPNDGYGDQDTAPLAQIIQQVGRGYLTNQGI